MLFYQVYDDFAAAASPAFQGAAHGVHLPRDTEDDSIMRRIYGSFDEVVHWKHLNISRKTPCCWRTGRIRRGARRRWVYRRSPSYTKVSRRPCRRSAARWRFRRHSGRNGEGLYPKPWRAAADRCTIYGYSEDHSKRNTPILKKQPHAIDTLYMSV